MSGLVRSNLKAIARGVAQEELVKHIDAALTPAFRKSRARTEALEARLAAVEQKLADVEAAGTKSLADAFRGSFQLPQPYQRGALVVFDGSLWLCLSDVAGSKPGESSAWRLVCRHGKDLREPR